MLHDTGLKVQCDGYLKGQGDGPVLPLVTAITCVELEGEDPILFLMNQACYYECSEQSESLCHPYQAMQHGVRFYLTPTDTLTPDGENGQQKMVVEEKDTPLRYDGRKLYLNIRKPTDEEIERLDIFEITSPNHMIHRIQ